MVVCGGSVLSVLCFTPTPQMVSRCHLDSPRNPQRANEPCKSRMEHHQLRSLTSSSPDRCDLGFDRFCLFLGERRMGSQLHLRDQPNIAMKNGPFEDVFPMENDGKWGYSIAMLVYQRVVDKWFSQPWWSVSSPKDRATWDPPCKWPKFMVYKWGLDPNHVSKSWDDCPGGTGEKIKLNEHVAGEFEWLARRGFWVGNIPRHPNHYLLSFRGLEYMFQKSSHTFSVSVFGCLGYHDSCIIIWVVPLPSSGNI